MNSKRIIKSNAYCIRCGYAISYDPEDPFCFDCGLIWEKYHNKYYKERYCHRCGRRWRTSKIHPFCEKCVHLRPPKDRIPKITKSKEEILKEAIHPDCPPHDWVIIDWVEDRKQERCSKCGKIRKS
ncbi:hypothetical protein [Candidatus Harpocratesius sp.]